jgi:tetratricopeptide (TPR) repeat protein
MCNQTCIVVRSLAISFHAFVFVGALAAQISPCAMSLMQRGSVYAGFDPFDLQQIPCTSKDASPAPQPSSLKTSVDVLRHPLSSRAWQMLAKARDLAKAGDHAHAIEILKQTMAQQPSSIPYAHSLLGVEYIRTGQYQTALDELEQAAVLLPHQPEIPANSAITLYLLGQFDRAEQEVRHALALDPTSPQAQKILEVLLSRKTLSENTSTP